MTRRYPLYPSPAKTQPLSSELRECARVVLDRLNDKVKMLRSGAKTDIDVVTEEDFTATQIMNAVIVLLKEQELPSVTFICWKQKTYHIFVMYFTVR